MGSVVDGLEAMSVLLTAILKHAASPKLGRSLAGRLRQSAVKQSPCSSLGGSKGGKYDVLLGSGAEYVRRTLRLLKPPSPAIRGEGLMGSAKVEVQHCIRLQRAPEPSQNRMDCPGRNARAQFSASLLRDRRPSPWRGWSAYDGFAQQRAPKFMTTTKWSAHRDRPRPNISRRIRSASFDRIYLR